MSENKKSMASTAMNYAIPLGLFWIFKYLFIIGGEYAEISKYINSILSIGTPLIAYALLCRYRDKELEGIITYKRSILFTITVFIFASLFETVISSLHLLVLNPGIVSVMNHEIYTELSKMNLPAIYMNQLDTILSYTGVYYIFSFILQNIIIGFFLALILGYFVSRQRNYPPKNM
ncbi:uncharacterized protein DUF4199 [Dysgonomonas alginatilytica]|uniref:Uncharacterized protein DUF4199 n=1 Tax=Dysgonomonas alginatilytica TaxID=1605892 RepID=A0A2V3PTF3_9BACT|nr:DUF4199 domain-containing protein [Dysgonomonas alginatilytica]PXV68849.1 uncharacterized protein DUF4199 [Dysgonomonas alginatilytica]